MIKLFGKNTVVQVAIILLVTTLLWIDAIADPQPMAASEGFAPLYSILCSLALPPTVTVIIAMVLVMMGAFYFNLILSNAGLAKQNSLFPTLLFIVFMSAGTSTLSPSLLAVLTALFFVDKFLLHSSHLDIAPDKIFGAAALIGIASMFYLPALSLSVAYILIAVNHRLYGWRCWMMFLLGLLAPYLLLWSILLFSGGLVVSFAAMEALFDCLSLHAGEFTSLQAIANAVLLAAFAISLFVVWRRLGEKNIVWQKNAATIMFITVASLATLPFAQLFPINFQFFAIPFTFCLDQRLSQTRRRPSQRRAAGRLYDLLLILIILAAIAC